jgi:hypothetical protein
MYTGIKSAILTSFEASQNPDMFSYIMPFVSFIVDASIKRAFLISASIPYITLKVVLILCYLVAYVLAI